MKAKIALSTILAVLFLAGCQSIPSDALKLTPTSLEQRERSTRIYDDIQEAEILASSIAILQDLGFNIEETEKRVGLLVGQKRRDATDGGQVAAAILVALLGGGSTPIDDEQVIRASIVTLPTNLKETGSHDRFRVRVTFQRIVWNNYNRVSRAEAINDPDIYKDFFERLENALFLEGHT